MRMGKILLFFAITLRCVLAAPEYKASTQIPIGGEGGWDILTIDDAARRLYLSHATKVIVLDIDTNKVVGEINDTPGVHAFVVAPELQRGFSSNGKENKSSIVDLTTMKTIQKVDVGENPDAIAYDAQRGQVYIFNHSGNSVTVLTGKDGKVQATIPLGGSPEFPAVDSAAGRIYINLEDKSEVAVIDTAKREVTARWPLAPGGEPTGMAFDAAHHRLFATCHNKLMVMLDTDSGKVVGQAPIGSGVDGCAFDEKLQIAFASCGEGVVTVVQEKSPNEMVVVQTLPTQRGARTIALDPKTHRIFLPTADFGPPSSPNGRPSVVPNTMRLLVYGVE